MRYPFFTKTATICCFRIQHHRQLATSPFNDAPFLLQVERGSAHTTWCTVLGHVSRSVGDVGLCDLGLGVGVVLRLSAHSTTGDAAVLYRITPPTTESDGAVGGGSLDFIYIKVYAKRSIFERSNMDFKRINC